jgi:hypothetical protein
MQPFKLRICIGNENLPKWDYQQMIYNRQRGQKNLPVKYSKVQHRKKKKTEKQKNGYSMV